MVSRPFSRFGITGLLRVGRVLLAGMGLGQVLAFRGGLGFAAAGRLRLRLLCALVGTMRLGVVLRFGRGLGLFAALFWASGTAAAVWAQAPVANTPDRIKTESLFPLEGFGRS